MRKILVLGHSHIAALSNGYRIYPPGVPMEFAGLYHQAYDPPVAGGQLTPALAARVRDAGADLHVAVIGGNAHFALSLLNHPQRFDLVLPEAPELPVEAGATLLPANLVQAQLEQLTAADLALLTAYRAAVSGRLVHIESPPPVPSEAHIRNHPDTFGAAIAANGVSPALVRYKFWRMHSRLWRAACARLGVEFLSVPAQMCDAAGMMIEAAWNPDPTHGNALYGGAVITKLLGQPA
jgi:hypothetical protein